MHNNPLGMEGTDTTHGVPVVSIIMPAYNTAAFIATALDSVLTQTFTQYEIIVVNDGSPDTDSLEKALKPYRSQIIYISQENGGSSAARNAALKIARGEFVAMLDSDDMFHPEYLESQIAVLESDPTIDVVYPDARRLDLNSRLGERYSDSYPLGGEITFARVLARECQIYGEVTARRDSILRAGMYAEDLRSGEDLDLWLRILKLGGRIVYNDRVLAYYRVRTDSHTADGRQITENVLRLLGRVEGTVDLTAEERAILGRQRAGLESNLRMIDGKAALRAGDASEAIRLFRDANHVRKSKKLSIISAALQIAPSVVVSLYRMRRQSS